MSICMKIWGEAWQGMCVLPAVAWHPTTEAHHQPLVCVKIELCADGYVMVIS